MGGAEAVNPGRWSNEISSKRPPNKTLAPSSTKLLTVYLARMGKPLASNLNRFTRPRAFSCLASQS